MDRHEGQAQVVAAGQSLDGDVESQEAEVEQKKVIPAVDPETADGNQEHLRPYCLSLQDGAADLPVWMRKMRTYFLLSNHSE